MSYNAFIEIGWMVGLFMIMAFSIPNSLLVLSLLLYVVLLL